MMIVIFFLKWGNIIFNKFVNGLKNYNDIDNIIQLIECIPYTVFMEYQLKKMNNILFV